MIRPPPRSPPFPYTPLFRSQQPPSLGPATPAHCYLSRRGQCCRTVRVLDRLVDRSLIGALRIDVVPERVGHYALPVIEREGIRFARNPLQRLLRLREVAVADQ